MKGDSRDDMSEEFACAFQGRLTQWWERPGRVPGEGNASDPRAPGVCVLGVGGESVSETQVI